jgi:hypothetical protein
VVRQCGAAPPYLSSLELEAGFELLRIRETFVPHRDNSDDGCPCQMCGLDCGPVDWSKQNEIVEAEAAYVPRGPRGSDQNIYLSVWAMARRSALGRRPQIGRSVDAAHDAALRAVRTGSPNSLGTAPGLVDSGAGWFRPRLRPG